MNTQPAQNENEVIFFLFTSYSDWDSKKHLYPFLKSVNLNHDYSRDSGLAIWNPQSTQLICISPSDIVILLRRIKADIEWKTKGLQVTRRVTRIPLHESKRGKRSKKIEIPEEQDQGKDQKPEYELIDDELITLNGDDAINLSTYLTTNESTIEKMYEEDQDRSAKKLWKVYKMLADHMHIVDESKLDLAGRELSWEKYGEHRWRISIPPLAGYVYLGWEGLLWVGTIDKDDEEVKRSEHFGELEKALDWVEQEIKAITSQPDFVAEEQKEEKPKPFLLTEEYRKQLEPYWIDPSIFDKEDVTYEVVIEFEIKPESYKTMKLESGLNLEYDKKFLSPYKLAASLQFDDSVMLVEQPFFTIGWYQLTSYMKYYVEGVAIEQAQKIWDQSLVAKKYREGKIIRARYGYREVFSEYPVFLGGLDLKDHPWPKTPERNKYTTRLALELSLIYAMDLEGYRSLMGFSRKHIKDDELLFSIHSERERSKFLPEQARNDSNEWLRKYKKKK